MAKNLSSFFNQNAIKKDEIKYVASNRFLDENKKPIEWILKPTDKKTDAKLRRESQKIQEVAGKSKLKEYTLDFDAYLIKTVASSVVYPNLNDSELQNSYNVMGAENLLIAMLLPGEIDGLYEKVQEVNGYIPLEELKDEAKN